MFFIFTSETGRLHPCYICCSETTSSNLKSWYFNESQITECDELKFYSILQTFHSIRVVVHGAALSKKQCTNFLNGIFRHYAFSNQKPKTYPNWPDWTPKTYPSWTNQNILSNLYILSSLSQSEYFCSLVADKHFKTMVTCESRLVSLPMFQRPCLQVFGRLRLSLTCLHLLSRDPSMNAWLSPSACTCRPVFENRSFFLTLQDTHLCTQAFLPDLTRNLSLHTGLMTLAFAKLLHVHHTTLLQPWFLYTFKKYKGFFKMHF